MTTICIELLFFNLFLGSELQLVLLPGTQYSTGQAFDIPNVVIEAHKVER